MGSDLKEYVALKRRVEQSQQKADKAEGALGEVMKRLKTEFGCSTLAEAKEKLKRLEKQGVIAKREFDNALRKFEEKWPDEST